MRSLPIAKHFDIVKDLDPSLLTDEIVPAMNKFHFHRLEEDFCHGIVPAISSSTHTSFDHRSSRLSMTLCTLNTMTLLVCFYLIFVNA